MQPPKQHEEANASKNAEITAVLTEQKFLHSEFGGFGSNFVIIDDHLSKVVSSVTTLENNMAEVKWEVASSATWMPEAEGRIMLTEEHLEMSQIEFTKAMKRIT